MPGSWAPGLGDDLSPVTRQQESRLFDMAGSLKTAGGIHFAASAFSSVFFSGFFARFLAFFSKTHFAYG